MEGISTTTYVQKLGMAFLISFKISGFKEAIKSKLRGLKNVLVHHASHICKALEFFKRRFIEQNYVSKELKHALRLAS